MIGGVTPVLARSFVTTKTVQLLSPGCWLALLAISNALVLLPSKRTTGFPFRLLGNRVGRSAAPMVAGPALLPLPLWSAQLVTWPEPLVVTPASALSQIRRLVV